LHLTSSTKYFFNHQWFLFEVFLLPLLLTNLSPSFEFFNLSFRLFFHSSKFKSQEYFLLKPELCD
jgi:hypothetical protein